MKKLLFISAALILLVSACSTKEGYDPYGKTDKASVSLSLSQTGEFTVPLQSSSNTKSGETKAAVDVSNFYVKIKQGETIVKSYDKYSEAPAAIEIEPGTYTIEAGTPSGKEAAFDLPVYYGKQEFTVQAGKISSVNLVCTLSNMKVTIMCSEAFNRELKDDYVFIVTNGKGILEYTKSIITAGTSGYFGVSPLTVTLQAHKYDGTELSHTISITKVAAKDHHILKFDVQETGEVGIIGISVDYSVNNREETIIIPGEDEEPVDEVPAITGTGISTPLTVTADQANAAGFKVETSVKTFNAQTIAALNVRIESPANVQTAIPGLGTAFDLANPATEQASVLNTLGILPTGTNIKVLDAYTFSVGGIVKALGAGTHKFHLTVTDSGGNTTTATITVTVQQAPPADEYLPTVEGTGISTPLVLTETEALAEGLQVEATVKTFNGKTISSLKVRIDSPAITEGMVGDEGMGLGMEFDMANPNARQAEMLATLNLLPAGTDLKTKNEFSFSVGMFMGLLGQGTHKFHVTIVDSEGKTATATLTIIINAD